jgi:hypothetical protein
MWNEFFPMSIPTTAIAHSVRLLRTLRAPCQGAPGQLIAGRAGARPDMEQTLLAEHATP